VDARAGKRHRQPTKKVTDAAEKLKVRGNRARNVKGEEDGVGKDGTNGDFPMYTGRDVEGAN
jgi:hypothetical protein